MGDVSAWLVASEWDFWVFLVIWVILLGWPSCAILCEGIHSVRNTDPSSTVRCQADSCVHTQAEQLFLLPGLMTSFMLYGFDIRQM